MESVPDWAYAWRPFANPDLIFKQLTASGQAVTFLIDPWNQHWAITNTLASVPRLLRLADGKTRFSEILRQMSETPQEERPRDGFVALAQNLIESGLIFNCRESHEESGLPVYNSSKVVGLHLEVTNACNMTCTHCYVASGKKLPNELTLEEIYAVIDMLPPFTGKWIALSGGEPAVRKDIWQIIEHCAITCGHNVDLYTNGKKFPRRLAEQIRELNQQGAAQIRIQMSLEAATPSLNDLVRGQGSFAAAIESLKMLKDMGLGPSVVLFVCVSKRIVKQIDDIIRLAEEYGVSMLVFSQWQKQGNASNTPWAEIAPTTEEWVAIGEKLLEYKNPKLRVYGNFYGDLNNNDIGRLSLDEPLFPKHTYHYNAVPRITPEGDIFADQMFVDADWILGNTRSITLAKAFESSKFHHQLEEMRGRTEQIEDCRKCEWKKLCEGGSPGHTYSEYGHMNAKDVFCESRKYWFERYVSYHTQKAVAAADQMPTSTPGEKPGGAQASESVQTAE